MGGVVGKTQINIFFLHLEFFVIYQNTKVKINLVSPVVSPREKQKE